MRIFTRSAALALLCFHMVSPAQETSGCKPWREIAAGSQSNIERSTREVIRNQEQWRIWWGKHNTVETMVDGKIVPGSPPEVDFTKETVLAATSGMHSTGGYTIRFSQVRREGEKVTATLKTTSPAPGEPVSMALTSPFCIIAVPRHEGRVEFVDESDK